MRYYRNPVNDHVHGYDENDPVQNLLIQQAIDNSWPDITTSWPPMPSAEQLQLTYRNLASRRLHDGAVSWGYMSLADALSFMVSNDPRRIKEAQLLSKWRDDVYSWLDSEFSKPNWQADATYLMAGMPSMPDRPTV